VPKKIGDIYVAKIFLIEGIVKPPIVAHKKFIRENMVNSDFISPLSIATMKAY